MQPIGKFRAGLIQASIFEQTVQGKKGEFKSHSVALQSSYQRNGEWVNRNLTLTAKNLDNAISVLQQAADSLQAAEEKGGDSQ